MKSVNCLFGMLLFALAASAADAETLVLTTNNPPTHFAVKQGLEPFMACVKDKSAGALDFNFFPSSQIVDEKASIDALGSGLAQVAYVVVSAQSDKLPLANLSILPGMGNTVEQMVGAWRKVLADGGPMAKELSDLHLVPLMVQMFPPYQVGLAGGKLSSIGDFAGKKLRVSGGAQTFGVKALGGVPVQIAASDAYVAMQQGTVDGYFLALTSVDSYKLQGSEQGDLDQRQLCRRRRLRQHGRRLFRPAEPRKAEGADRLRRRDRGCACGLFRRSDRPA